MSTGKGRIQESTGNGGSGRVPGKVGSGGRIRASTGEPPD